METVCPSYITHNLVSTNIILLMLLKAYSRRGWVSSGPIGFSTISIHIAMILKNWLSIHHFILYMTAWFISPPPPLQLAMCVKSLQDGSSYTFTGVIYLLYFRKGWQKKSYDDTWGHFYNSWSHVSQYIGLVGNFFFNDRVYWYFYLMNTKKKKIKFRKKISKRKILTIPSIVWHKTMLLRRDFLIIM